MFAHRVEKWKCILLLHPLLPLWPIVNVLFPFVPAANELPIDHVS